MSFTEDCVRRLLVGVASGRPVSQRSLARELGVALGLTNLLMRRLARKGWIRVIRIKPNRVLYLITPAGLAEKARISRQYFQRSLTFYAEARDRIRQSFEHLMVQPAERDDGVLRIVFFGGGKVAEVGYVVLAETTFRLVAVVDDSRHRPFFGVPVRGVRELTAEAVAGEPYDRLVVMSYGDPAEIRSELQTLGIPDDKIHWLEERPPRGRSGPARPRRGARRTRPAARGSVVESQCR